MQQTQQHMFKQLEQCMQQTYSGLSLGTPVHAKEYTEQFKKNNNTVMLTKTKWLDIAPNESDWDDNQDFTSHGDTAITAASSCRLRQNRYSVEDHYTH